MPPLTSALLAITVGLMACSAAAREAPVANRAADDAALEGRPAAGELGGHRFTIALGAAGEEAQLVQRERARWSWKLGNGEIVIQDLGAADDTSHVLVERSPRTIVRGEGRFTVVSEVVVIVAGRVFSCLHEEQVADPDAPAARVVIERGIAVCSSLRVEP